MGPADDPSNGLNEIKAIARLTGEVRFIDLNTMEGVYSLRIYDTLIDPITGERDLSMVPTEAMDPYVIYDGIVAVHSRIF